MINLNTPEPVRILVVDDEAVVRDVIRSTLERPDIFIVDVEDGESAISLILSEPFDLVIADKNLPGITGMDVIRRAKAVDPNIGALLITAYVSSESAKMALAIGVDDYVEKPFNISDLERKVHDSIKRRRAQQSAGSAQTQTNKIKSPIRSVLVCEPDVANCAIIVDGLEILGHRSKVVSKVTMVIDSLRNKQADALICDLELLSRQNATSHFLRSILLVNPEVRFVAVTDGHEVDGIMKAIHHGAKKVLYHPLIDGQTVAKSLERFLGNANK